MAPIQSQDQILWQLTELLFYQIAVLALENVKPISEVASLGANLSVCKKFCVNQSYLSEWIANLRKVCYFSMK